jgi:hypothetical protein
LVRLSRFCQRQTSVDIGLEVSLGKPVADLLGTSGLLFSGSPKHDKAPELTLLDIKRPYRESRPSFTASHQNHAPTRSQGGNRQIHVRFAQCFPPDIDSLRSERFQAMFDRFFPIANDRVSA